MRFDLVQAFDRDRIPSRAARLWDGDPRTLLHLRSGRSFVYSFATPGKKNRVLRITHEIHRPREQLVAELEFIGYLADHGCPVVVPVRSRSGALVEDLPSSLGRLAVCCFDHVAGREAFRAAADDMTREFAELGRLMGRIHRLSRSFVPRGPRRYRWDEDRSVRDPTMIRYLPDRATRNEHRLLLRWLGGRPETPDTFGLVHGDLTPGNVVVGDRGYRVFDFDECCYHWFGYDFAAALISVSSLSDGTRSRILDALLAGYQQEHALPFDTREEIDWFWRWRTLVRFMNQMRRRDRELIPPWEENRRQLAAFPVASLPPWEQNHLTKLRGQMFGRLHW